MSRHLVSSVPTFKYFRAFTHANITEELQGLEGLYVQPFPSHNATSDMPINPSSHNQTKEAIFTVNGVTLLRDHFDIVYSFSYVSVPLSPHKHKHAYAEIYLYRLFIWNERQYKRIIINNF